MIPALALLVAAALEGTGSVAGSVVGTGGAGIPNAVVMLELGLEGELIETRTDHHGAFRFQNVGSGTAGVFAIAQGYAFGGDTVNLALGSEITNVIIALEPESSLTGRVVDFQSQPVAGAQVTRVAILGETAKVGIPLNRLAAYGIQAPVSGSDGQFTVPKIPARGNMALKVSHSDYAQSGVDGIQAGQRAVEVMMHKGVLVHGHVETRGESAAVANAVIVFSNAQPPNDTSITRTNPQGEFEIRLNPGVYLYRAEGAQFKSPAWERLTIRGDSAVHRVALRVARLGRVRGAVRDVHTEAPIEDARLALVAGGQVAKVFRTGPGGVFDVEAASGITEVRIDSAPGYLPPPRNALRIDVSEGETFELPIFWLAPIPQYSVQVLKPDETPAPGAVVRLLVPEQVGGHVADANGRTDLAVRSVPAGGRILGIAEDPATGDVAVFAIEQQRTEEALVRLMEPARLNGTVVNDRGRVLEGAPVSVYYADGVVSQPVLLWRARAGRGGLFSWNGAPPRVPLQVIGYSGGTPKAGEALASGQSAPVILDAAQTKDVGRVVVPRGERGTSLIGKRLKWSELPLLCGPAPATQSARPAVITYCTVNEAQAVTEALDRLRGIGAFNRVDVAVVVDGAWNCEGVSIPVLRGAAPGPASTYCLDGSGTVRTEAYGLPTFEHVRQLLRDTGAE